MEYGERLEAALIQQIKVEMLEAGGMEQKDLAEKVGINRVTMSHYMTGKRSIPMPTFAKIAQAFGLTAFELMTRAEARLQAD